MLGSIRNSATRLADSSSRHRLRGSRRPSIVFAARAWLMASITPRNGTSEPLRELGSRVRQASRPDSSRRNQENTRGRQRVIQGMRFRRPYGMGPEALARRIGKPTAYSCELLRLHRETYPAFWRWSDGAQSHAMLLSRFHTVFGWTIRVGPNANPRSRRNFPCQANGAEMMRLACCLATERGVNVVAPVHDALMVEGPADAIDDIVARTQEAMAEASAFTLDGSRLRSDASIVRWPDRYMDGRGREFWGRVMALLPAESDFTGRAELAAVSGPSDAAESVPLFPELAIA
jgi:DNA polymerase family A